MDHAYAANWYDLLRKNEASLPTITQDRIFLFKGKDGPNGKATTTDEYHMWIESMLPPPGMTVAPKKFCAESYINYCQNSASDLAHQVRNEELKILKHALENQEAQTRTMREMMQKMMQKMQKANQDQHMSMMEMQERMSKRMDEMVKAGLQYRQSAPPEEKQKLNWLGSIGNKVGNWFKNLFGL